MKTLFATSSIGRKKKNSQTVRIINTGDRVIARRTATHGQGKPHIQNVAGSYQLLLKHLSGCSISEVLRLRTNELDTQFVEGSNLVKLIEKSLVNHQYSVCIDYLKKYKEIISSLKSAKESPYDSEEFVNTFDPKITYKVNAPDSRLIEIAPLDLLPSNLIVNDSGWWVIDYEWLYNFPVEVGYIYYRALLYTSSILQRIIRKRVSEDLPCVEISRNIFVPVEWVNLFHITNSDIPRYTLYENNFLNHVHESFSPYDQYFVANLQKVTTTYATRSADTYIEEWNAMHDDVAQYRRQVDELGKILEKATLENESLRTENERMGKQISQWNPVVTSVESSFILKKLSTLMISSKSQGRKRTLIVYSRNIMRKIRSLISGS